MSATHRSAQRDPSPPAARGDPTHCLARSMLNQEEKREAEQPNQALVIVEQKSNTIPGREPGDALRCRGSAHCEWMYADRQITRDITSLQARKHSRHTKCNAQNCAGPFGSTTERSVSSNIEKREGERGRAATAAAAPPSRASERRFSGVESSRYSITSVSEKPRG
jgi:hypothetical protein